MSVLLHLVLLSVVLACSFIVIFLLVFEKDLLKMIVLSAAQSALYSIVLYILMVPDVALAYVAVAVGIYTALLMFAVRKTERFEEA